MGDQLAVFIDFENVAIWAEQHFFDLDMDRLMGYLQSRGPVVVKRAYGDWSRFSKYRDDMLDNSIDLIQLYSIRAGKNRADIRLALDAFEIIINRPQIGTVVIVSGDSDFGALASKLREYGMRILGIGPRAVTHQLLVKSCDEFVYLETVLGQAPQTLDGAVSGRESARKLLKRSLAAHGARGKLPILATKLKDALLSMDPTFNEANLGYGQFRTWLEDNGDLVTLFFRNLQMYAAPVDFRVPQEFTHAPKPPAEREGEPGPRVSLADSYARLFNKIIVGGLATRRDVLRDIYRELYERPGEWTLSVLLDELQSRYESKGLARSKTQLRKIAQLGFYQRVYEYRGNVSVNTPVELAEDIDSQATFIRRAEAQFVYAVVKSGLEIDQADLAATLLYDRASSDYIQELLDDLERRGRIVQVDGQYRLPGRSEIPLLDDPNLRDVIRELRTVQLGQELGRGVETARNLAKSGRSKHSHDFAAATRDYLLACRLQWDAVERQEPGATLEDLRWYITSYVSAKAGDLSQGHGEFASARPYYVAFFSLVQEGTPLWDRVRQLINPMLYFYWGNIAREMNVDLPYTRSPAVVAVQIATQANDQLRATWGEATRRLAQVNPEVLRRVANQIRLTQAEMPWAIQVAERIEGMLGGEG